jgi:oligopeptidase B
MSDMLYSLPSFILSMVMSVYGSRIFRPISRKFTTTISMNNSPPVAKKIATTVYFGTNPSTPDIFRGENIMNPPKLRNDDYFWMRDETRENPAVLAHIEAENAYTEEVMKDLRHLKDDLYADMLANLKETDEDVPFQHGDYMYYSRTMKGLPYPIHCRTPVGSTDEQVVLDENKIGEGYEYSDVSSSEPCPAHKLMAYSVDHDGYETYTLKIIDISTGQHLSDEIEEMSGDFVWGSDSSVIYYMKMDEEHRPNRLYMHVLGTDASLDTLLLAEDDGMFWMGIEKSNSDRFLLISLGSKETSEYHYIDLDGLIGAEAHVKAISNMKCIQARQFGLRFDVEHHGEYFYLVTNAEKAKNNKIVYCPIDEPSKANWLDLVPYNPDVQIDELLPFANHFAIFGRENGIQVAWVAEASNPKQWRKISFGEETYSVWTEANCIYEAQVLRLGYTSFLTPKQVLDYDMISGTRTVLKEKEVPNYEPTNYRSSRIEATASDGRKIPMSLVFHKDAAPTDATRPLLLYGYGSYGACIEPTFDYKRISLLDRGVVYAIAHIRY